MMRRTACRRIMFALTLLHLFVIVLVRPIGAQSRTNDESQPRYSFVFSGISVSEALITLIDRTDINLIFESEVVAGHTTFCRANKLPIDALLSCILKDTELDYVRLSSGTYVVIRSARGDSRFGRILGSVRDVETGQPVEDANIVLLTEDVGAASNRAGRFIFSPVVPGPHILAVSHISYEHFVDTVYVAPDESETIRVDLKKRTLLADPIIVSDFAETPSSVRMRSDLVSDVELLDLNPLATLNVLQTIDFIDGVGLGESLSSIHLQGSDSGEHAYRLDGATVYVPIRLGGLIGPFSPFAISQIQVRKAGYGVSLGSQLAGIIDVTHQIAPSTSRRAEFQIDPLSLNARVSGRTRPESAINASWMLAARRDLQYAPYFDRLDNIMKSWSAPDFFLADELRKANGIHALTPEVKGQIADRRSNYNVGFADFHAAAKMNLGSFHSLQASLYQNRNLFGENLDSVEEQLQGKLDSDDRYRWENTTAQLTYEGILSGRTFLDASLSLSNYNLIDTFGSFPLGVIADSTCVVVCDGPRLADDFNEVRERRASLGARYAVNLRHSLSARIEIVNTSSDFTLTLDPFEEPILSDELRRAIQWRLAGFVEDAWSIAGSLSLKTGMRLTYLPDQETVYAEPRIALQMSRNAGQRGRLAVQVSAGLYRQFIHQVDVTTFNLNALFPSIRFWMPLDRAERPPKAIHFSGGILYEPTHDWSFSVDSYYKIQPHLLVLNYGDETPESSESRSSDAPPLLVKASGIAYGLSAAVERHTKWYNLRVRYDYSRAERAVENRYDGARMSVPWSVPHSFLVSFEWIPSDELAFTVRWHTIIGRAWGFRRAYYDYLLPLTGNDLYAPFDLSNPEAHKMPTFMQLDAGITHTMHLGPVDVQTRIHVLNILGRDNVRDWSLIEKPTTGALQKTSRLGIPFLPMFSIRLGV